MSAREGLRKYLPQNDEGRDSLEYGNSLARYLPEARRAGLDKEPDIDEK